MYNHKEDYLLICRFEFFNDKNILIREYGVLKPFQRIRMIQGLIQKPFQRVEPDSIYQFSQPLRSYLKKKIVLL